MSVRGLLCRLDGLLYRPGGLLCRQGKGPVSARRPPVLVTRPPVSVRGPSISVEVPRASAIGHSLSGRGPPVSARGTPCRHEGLLCRASVVHYRPECSSYFHCRSRTRADNIHRHNRTNGGNATPCSQQGWQSAAPAPMGTPPLKITCWTEFIWCDIQYQRAFSRKYEGKNVVLPTFFFLCPLESAATVLRSLFIADSSLYFIFSFDRSRRSSIQHLKAL